MTVEASNELQVALEKAILGNEKEAVDAALKAGADPERAPVTDLAGILSADIDGNLTILARLALDPVMVTPAWRTNKADRNNRPASESPRAIMRALFVKARIRNQERLPLGWAARDGEPIAPSNTLLDAMLLGQQQRDARGARRPSNLERMTERALRRTYVPWATAERDPLGDFFQRHLSGEALAASTPQPLYLTQMFCGLLGHLERLPPGMALATERLRPRIPLFDGHVLGAATKACGSYQPEVIEDLIDAGLDVNGRDHSSMTPLLHAAYGGSSRALEVLVRRGADIAVTDPHGRRPIELLKAYVDLLERIAKQRGRNHQAGARQHEWMARLHAMESRSAMEQMLAQVRGNTAANEPNGSKPPAYPGPRSSKFQAPRAGWSR